MPTLTFEKLSDEKKIRVLKAAMKEFSRAPLNEASVANIIIDAEIPRGSFYQYFKDKEELFFYILEVHSKDIKKYLVKSLLKYKGDIIRSFIDTYQYILEKINEEENAAYFKNIFLNMNYELERMFTPNLEDNLNDVVKLIDIEKLNVSNRLQLIYLIDIIEAVMIRNIIQSYKRNISMEKNVEIFTREMLLIKEGIYKK